MKNFIEKTSTWAGNISSISKLLIGLFFLIFTIGTEWYQIQVNLKTNIKQEKDIKDSKSYAEKIFNELSQNIKKENKLQQEKFNETNKRFIENLNTLFKNWKPRKRFSVIKVDDSTKLDNYNPAPISLTPEFLKEIQSI